MSTYRCGPIKLQETRRVARLLQMAWLIGNSPGRWTRAALAARYEVSSRQITRDLDLLRHTLCCEIVRYPGTGYRFASPPSVDWLTPVDAPAA